MATVDNLQHRLDVLLERVGRPSDRARYEAEFDALEAREDEGAAEKFEVWLIHALTAEYAHEDMKPGIVKLFESMPWDEAMRVLQVRADADRQRDKEQYVLARMRGWKY